MSSKKTFSKVVKTLSVLAVVSGIANLLFGLHAIPTASTPNSPSPDVAPIDSQLRFFASAWIGCGVISWWASNDIQHRYFPLIILGGALVVGGLGRFLAGWKYGSNTFLKTAMGIEISAPFALFYLYCRSSRWSTDKLT